MDVKSQGIMNAMRFSIRAPVNYCSTMPPTQVLVTMCPIICNLASSFNIVKHIALDIVS